MRFPRHFQLIPLAIALQAVYPHVHAATVDVAAGTTDSTAKTLTKDVPDNITIHAGGTLTSTSADTIGGSLNNTNLTTVTIDNAGTISQTGGLAAINIGGKNVNLVLTNEAGGLITSSSTDAKTPTIAVGKGSDTFTIVNLGTISQTAPTSTNEDNGKDYAININGDYSQAGNTLVNGSATNSTATITSSSSTAIKMGSNTMITNYGQIFTTSLVNTSCPDYIALCKTATPPKAADGISIDDKISNAVIVNYGNITGSRHGIDGGDPTSKDASANLHDTVLGNAIKLDVHVGASGVTFDATYADGTVRNNVNISNNVVINQASGVITGKNGSGVGFDSHGVVFNYGTITGNYAGAGNVFDVLGDGSTVNNGDGDGVDIDGTAYVENWGTIKGTGAGGLDSTGIPNGADGIASGGGTVINHVGAVISGDAHGILIDDGDDALVDATNPNLPSTGGRNTTGRGTATVNGSTAYIVNEGSITGVKGIAIGLVGNYDDTLINNATGVITGGAQAKLTGQGGSTAAGAAVQMGAGNDTLTNYGRIEGKNGLAIDMGEGDDSLQLLGGTVIGSIDGGNGVDTLTTGGAQTFTSGVLTGFENFVVQSGTTTFNYDLGTVGNVTVNSGAALQINGAFGTSGDLTVNGTFKTIPGRATRTVDVGGNFALGATGTLEVGIDGTQSDKIAAAGSAAIANGATVKALMKTYVPDNASWTIVSAAGGLTADVSQLQVADTATLDYSLKTTGNDLVLNVQRTGTASSITGTGNGGIGQALDALFNGAGNSPQTTALITALDALPTADAYRAAVKQLEPETNHASQQAAQVAMGSVFSAVGDRIDTARGGSPVASNGSTGVATGEQAAGSRAWLQGLGAWGKQDARAGADGYRISAYGMAGGLETDLSAREVAGVTIGYTRAGARGSDGADGNNVDVDAFNIGGYMGRDMGGWTLDTSLMLGTNHYSSTRVISFLGETVNGSYNGWQIGARVEAGLPFAINNTWSGRWLAGLRASHLDNESYTESGNAAVAQNVGSSNANSFQPTLGAELNRVGADGGRLQLHARYLRELAGNPDITASFVAGGPSFTAPGAKQNRDALQFGTSYRWNSTRGGFVMVGYDAEIRDRSLVNQVTARAGLAF